MAYGVHQARAPELNYGTALFPAADDHPDLYGSQRVGGTIVGIPKGSKYPDQAWLLVKFLSTDPGYITTMANQVGNVPTTLETARSPDLKLPDTFQPFIDVWQNKDSSFSPPLTTAGRGYFLPLQQFVDKWQAGNVSDLQTGLQKVDSRSRTTWHWETSRSSRGWAASVAEATRPSAAGLAARRPCGRYGLVLLLLSPWIVGFCCSPRCRWCSASTARSPTTTS